MRPSQRLPRPRAELAALLVLAGLLDLWALGPGLWAQGRNGCAGTLNDCEVITVVDFAGAIDPQTSTARRALVE